MTPLTLVAPVALAAAAATAAWEAAKVHQIHLAAHCGFDGASWCAMAEGGRGDAPYQRRFLLPLVVRAMHFGNVVTRFLAVDLLACAAIAICTSILTRRFAGILGAPKDRARAVSIISGALTVFAVYPLRFTLMVPVNTDVAGAALVLAWLVIVTTPNIKCAWLSPFVVAAAVMTRDMNGPALLAATLVMLLLSGPDRRRVAAVNALTIAMAAFATTLVPAVPGTSSSVVHLLHLTSKSLRSIQGMVVYGWLVLTGVGLVALLALPTLRWVGKPVFAPAWALILTGGAVGTAIGGTVDRYLLPPLIVLVALAAAYVASQPRWDLALIVLSGASIALWRPWLAMSGDVHRILRAYDAYIQPWSVNRSHIGLDMRNIVIGAGAAGLFAMIARLCVRPADLADNHP